MANNIPDKIKIGPLEFAIKMRDDVSNSFYGLECFSEQNIFIRSGLSSDYEKVILLHEILHVIFDVNGIADTEENHKIIYDVSNYLGMLLKDNPDLCTYLVGEKDSE
jgi:hypothetical protein